MKLVLGRAVAGAAALAMSMSVVAGTASAHPAVVPARTQLHAKALTGAVTLGQTFAVASNCGGGTTTIQSVLDPAAAPVSYTVPDAGVITGFSYAANNAGGQVRAVLMGTSATPSHHTLVGASAPQTVALGLNTFRTRITAPKGAVLGLYVSQNDMGCYATGLAGDTAEQAFFNPATETDFVGPLLPGERVNISAVLEPDVDHDGYGDTSQDACPQSATTQAACPAPDTRVTKKPRKSSTRAKVKIKFTSVPGATYTCAVDKKAAKRCTSPFKKRFKPGKHKVVITATSPAGIVEVAPATVKFKILRAR